MKKFFLGLVLTFVIIAASVFITEPLVLVQAANSALLSSKYYTEITASQAKNMFDSGESFNFIYYSDNCGICISAKSYLEKLITDNQIKLYGVNGSLPGNNTGLSFMWACFDSSISYPVLMSIENGVVVRYDDRVSDLNVMYKIFNISDPNKNAPVHSVLKLSGDTDKSFSIYGKGTDLYFENIPNSTGFKSMLVSLKGEKESNFSGRVIERSSTGTAVYSIYGISDGIYYLQLFNNKDENGSYWSYIYGNQVRITVKEGKAYFDLSPVYDNNMKIFTSKRTDKEALKYYLQPSYGIQSDDKTIIELAVSITKNKKNDFEKTKAIHNWVCNNIWYNYDAYNGKEKYGDTSALGTLNSKRSVCQGYASLTAALLRAAGIPAKLVSGYALGVSTSGAWTETIVNSTDSNHAWNEAYVDGRWIILDTTWDSDNKYENKVFSKGTGLEGYKYFNPTMEIFSSDHKLLDYSESSIPTYE